MTNKLIAFIVVSLLILPIAHSTKLENRPYLNDTWIKKEFPIVEKDNIKIVYHPFHLWYAMYYYPNVVIIFKNHNQSEKVFRKNMEHELMHHYCWKKFKDVDPKHLKCFLKNKYTPKYNST